MIRLNDLSIHFRGPPLLDEVDCQIEAGERIGLLGRNGSGKTTLMRIVCGQVEPDSGQVRVAPGTTISMLPQEIPRHCHGRTSEVVAEGLRACAAGQVESPVPADHGEVLEPAWKQQQRLEQIMSRMELDPEAHFETLSSGMKRRVLLARALVADPDLLLLDEPTNHLDIAAITWLEAFLNRWGKAFLFVTHDRMFLRRLASRILEIDRGRLFDWSCDYDTFVQRKEAALAAEEKQHALFDKELAQEEVWIRQGIKARRTRNEGRVRALQRMRRQRAQRRDDTATVQMRIQEGVRSGNLVARLEDVSFRYEDREIVDDFSTTIMRGDKVGVMGPNGAGKTTLLRLLLGQLPPQSGSVRLGTNLQIAYFDQQREQLIDERSVQENVGDGSQSVGADQQRRHIIGYLHDFLFTPERARTPVRFLSGGERNRVLLARLFAKPANVIVLDEPTNDLDTETLELLEQRLVHFQGTVLLVSHDRDFLNNVVTSTIVFEETGVRQYVGGYDDWLRQREESLVGATSSRRQARPGPRDTEAKPSRPPAKPSRRRLTYREQQELEQLPTAIEQREAEISALHQAMARPEFYQQPGEVIAGQQNRLRSLESELAAAYQRWEGLEERAE
jgi:ATP-binding cassette subfamily F protein uup